MKTLTLLRHAKSGWDDPSLADVDRPLNDTGRRAARTMGRHLAREGTVFDRVVASPAVRVAETLSAIEAAYGRSLAAVVDKRLYLASPTEIMAVVGEQPDTVDHLLVVGHNPGLEELTLELAAESDARDTAEAKFPTATFARLTWDGGWASPGRGGATLACFTRPRDLDPSLGPDED